MSETKKLEIDASCWLEHFQSEFDPWEPTLNYIEHSPDGWYSDSETEVSLSRETARAIVRFLCDAYPGLMESSDD